uniref:OadG family protein n=1 Tax=Alistipes sp. TaxID=1872444 RepID=UPI004056E581
MDKFANVGWPEMLLMAGLGFAVVFTVLVLLIFIMKGMGWVFTHQRKAAKIATKGVAAADEHDAITDQEIAAAIITALKLYKSNLHDKESEMITIHRIARAYSPWSSKIHGLTQVPERK